MMLIYPMLYERWMIDLDLLNIYPIFSRLSPMVNISKIKSSTKATNTYLLGPIKEEQNNNDDSISNFIMIIIVKLHTNRILQLNNIDSRRFFVNVYIFLVVLFERHC
jgi:hypothetical protein